MNDAIAAPSVFRQITGMGILLIVLILASAPRTVQAQIADETIQITPNLEVLQLTEDVWLHITWKEMPEWGRVRSNGLIVVSEGRALLVDTAWGTDETESLLSWIMDALGVPVVRAVVTHAHDDRMGGMEALRRAGVVTYANTRTAELAARQSWPEPDSLFTDVLVLRIGKLPLEVFFPGAGHTPDNVVVWLPAKKLLFGGCLIKEAGSLSLGNLADADVDAWPVTIKRVINRYQSAEVVVPSHGPVGDKSLLQHTLKLCNEYVEKQTGR